MTEAISASVIAASAPVVPPGPDALSSSTLSSPRRQRQLLLVDDAPAPVVKWVGGKGRLVSRLSALLPREMTGCYLEPFAGGAAMFFHLRPERAVLGDTNRDLIELYAEIARDPVGLHAQIRALVDAHLAAPEATYYGTRDGWNKERRRWKPQRRAAAFLYMNKACFNGLYRVNKAGEMNVSMGKPGKEGDPFPRCPPLASFVAAQGALRDARLCCADYIEVIASASRGDFVYLDPPYEPKSKTGNFTSYTKLGFGPSDHQEMSRHARELVDRGVRVMISSADVPGARERYAGFSVTEVMVGRSVSSKITERGKVGELIFTGGYEIDPQPVAGSAP